MRYKFILQCDKDGQMSSDVNTIREIIDSYNWWNRIDNEFNDTDTYEVCQLNELDRYANDIDKVIPVGSLEFVEELGKMLGCGDIPALNVPESLNLDEYTNRLILYNISNKKLRELLRDNKEFLVKPEDYAKRFDCEVIKGLEVERFTKSHKGPYFISSILENDIVSEWRVFFIHNRIVGIKPYYVKDWAMPDKGKTERMLREWKDKPPSGTLDVAVLDNSNTVIIEAHPFISCGLYGYDSPDILNMLAYSWNWYKSINKQNLLGGQRK